VADSVTKLLAAPKLEPLHAITVEWRAMFPEIVRWKQNPNRVTNAAKKATSPETVLMQETAGVVDTQPALVPNATNAAKLVTLLEVVPPAVAEDIAVAVVEVEDSAVQAASVPKLATIAVV